MSSEQARAKAVQRATSAAPRKGPDGRWSFVVDGPPDPATGKRTQLKRRGYPTKKAAQAELDELRGKVTAGTYRKVTDLTVRELLVTHWQPAQRSRGLRPTTVALHVLAVDHWLLPFVGGTKAAALTPAVVVDLVDRLRIERGLSARSTQMAVSTLKRATKWATANGLLALDPIAAVDTPRAARPELAVWDREQARAFLDGVRGDRLEWAWALLLTRGLRRGEVCGLKWSDIDLDGGSLRIVRTRITVDGQPATSAPKTAAGRRAVPLDGHLVTLLRAHKARQAAEKLAAGAAYADDGWLFADELGRPYYPDSLSEWFTAKVQKLGLPRIRLHDTRHTAASLMLGDGVPVHVVSKLLGHASPTITLSVYAHVLPGAGEEAEAALSASLLG